MEPYAAIALVTFLVTYGALATEKINRTVVVGAGSLVLLITGVLTLAEAINYVSWETIGLLFGMFIIVVGCQMRGSSHTWHSSLQRG